MKAYKLTDEKDRTHGGCQWGQGVTHEADGKGELCTEHWIHYYSDPVLALFLNPIHADFANPHLWECEVEEPTKHDHGLKSGTIKLTTIKRLRKKRITTRQRIKFAILCAKRVYKDTGWNKWADAWLNGMDRSSAAAYAAAADAAADAADADAAAYAAYAADADAHAAYAAYDAAAHAAAAAADAAAHAAAAAADAAAAAAYAAARAADAASYAAYADIDLAAIARKAIS